MDQDDAPVGRILTRREALALLGGTALAACAPGALASPTAVATASGAASTGAVAMAPQCVVVPALTEGPYFVDEKLARSDIRADATGGEPRPGAQLELTFSVGRVGGSACTPLRGATVDVWHCDALGVYSDASDPSFDTKGQTWLRGYQTTDAAGLVRFTTIYPGWYQGRAVHIHFKVRTPAAGGTADFTSQLFFDESVTDAVYAETPYSQKGASGRLRNERDGIFQQSGGKTLISPAKSGPVYAATFALGLAA